MQNKPYIAKKSFFDIALISEIIVFLIGWVVVFTSSTYRKIGFLIIGLMIVAAFFQIISLVAFKATVKDGRMQIIRGVFSRSTEEINLNSIASVKVSQSFFGRLFNFGDVTIDVVGKSPVLLSQINNCIELKEALEQKM